MMDEPQRVRFEHQRADDTEKPPRQGLCRLKKSGCDGRLIGRGKLDGFALGRTKRRQAVRDINDGAGRGRAGVIHRRHANAGIRGPIGTVRKKRLKDLPAVRPHDDVIAQCKASLEAVVLHAEQALFGGKLMTCALKLPQTLPAVFVYCPGSTCERAAAGMSLIDPLVPEAYVQASSPSGMAVRPA